MIRQMIWGLIVAATVSAIGCGGSGGGGGSNTSTPPPPPLVVLTALDLICTDTDLDEGDSVAMTTMGYYSDGTSGAVVADWTTPHASKVTLSSPRASSITVTAISDGSATVTAAAGGLSDFVVLTIDWIFPPDPGTVYGCPNSTRGVYRYPTDGSSAPTLIADMTSGNGLTYDPTRGVLYGLSSETLTRIDPVTSATTVVATLPPDGQVYMGLDVDTSGRVYAQGLASAGIHRYDPVTSTTVPIGLSDYAAWMLDLAIGPGDVPYYAPMFPGGASGLIRRHDLATDTTSIWAPLPTGVTGFTITGGVVMNRKGTAYGAVWRSDLGSGVAYCTIYRVHDTNGNGTISASEVVPFAEVPGYMALGLANGGGGSLLVNLNSDTAGGAEGIYWMRDLNNNGTTIGDEATEVMRYHPAQLGGSADGQCMVGTR